MDLIDNKFDYEDYDVDFGFPNFLNEEDNKYINFYYTNATWDSINNSDEAIMKIVEIFFLFLFELSLFSELNSSFSSEIIWLYKIQLEYV